MTVSRVNHKFSNDFYEDEASILFLDETIDPAEIFSVTANGCTFVEIPCNFEKRVHYYYIADTEKDIFEDSGYDETGMPFYSINRSNKRYCIELIKDSRGFFKINFITTQPKGCSGVECKRLNGLFSVIKKFLEGIGYTGIVSLEDDVMVNGSLITYDRFLEGKPSIYAKYGFCMSDDKKKQLDLLKSENRLEELRKSMRNIFMVAQNVSNFDKCT